MTYNLEQRVYDAWFAATVCPQMHKRYVDSIYAKQLRRVQTMQISFLLRTPIYFDPIRRIKEFSREPII